MLLSCDQSSPTADVSADVPSHESSADSVKYPLLDEKYGFNNVKLESGQDEIGALVRVSSKKNLMALNLFGAMYFDQLKMFQAKIDSYVKKDDTEQIGEITIDSIVYTFYKNKLYQIHIESSGNYHLMKEALIDMYGEPSRASTTGATIAGYSPLKHYYWEGEKVVLHLQTFSNDFITQGLVEKDREERGEEKVSFDKIYGHLMPITIDYWSKSVVNQIEVDENDHQNGRIRAIQEAL